MKQPFEGNCVSQQRRNNIAAEKSLTWVCDQLKASNWSAENRKKVNDLNKLKLEPAARSCATGQQIPLSDSCQMTITWTSIIKLNVGCRLPDKLKNAISHWLSLVRTDERTFGHIWRQKFLGCIDHKNFLPMVLCYSREKAPLLFFLIDR